VASATLLDLAARRVVEIHQVAAGGPSTRPAVGRGMIGSPGRSSRRAIG
jgi:hypothetical protein